MSFLHFISQLPQWSWATHLITEKKNNRLEEDVQVFKIVELVYRKQRRDTVAMFKTEEKRMDNEMNF